LPCSSFISTKIRFCSSSAALKSPEVAACT
jgi:hypothetical protein